MVDAQRIGFHGNTSNRKYLGPLQWPISVRGLAHNCIAQRSLHFEANLDFDRSTRPPQFSKDNYLRKAHELPLSSLSYGRPPF